MSHFFYTVRGSFIIRSKQHVCGSVQQWIGWTHIIQAHASAMMHVFCSVCHVTLLLKRGILNTLNWSFLKCASLPVTSNIWLFLKIIIGSVNGPLCPNDLILAVTSNIWICFTSLLWRLLIVPTLQSLHQQKVAHTNKLLSVCWHPLSSRTGGFEHASFAFSAEKV